MTNLFLQDTSVDMAQRTRPSPAVAGCRFCGSALHDFIDLGMSPLCESFVAADDLGKMEAFYPLDVKVCGECFLAQLPELVSPAEIFTDYAYYSSYSPAFVAHARSYVDMIVDRLRLNERSLVIELASNDGYLLQHFLKKKIPILGIEPAQNVARAARKKGVPTLTRFFDADEAERLLAAGHRKADLIIANNVLAQVPNLNAFVEGIGMMLAPDGVATVEFPGLMTLLENCLYDTIYHEHFSYFSLSSAQMVFAAHGMRLFDVEEVWTHGGSLRIYACHARSPHQTTDRVAAQKRREAEFGLNRLDTYASFAERVKNSKWDLVEFLIGARRDGKSVAGYGAPGKGNTLLNYCGIRADLLEYTVDRNPHKHGKFLPGTRIPIFPPERIGETRPDYIVILPWNLKDEIIEQLDYVRDWNARFVIPIPHVEVINPNAWER